MPVAQLSLWDNEALERGYHCLADLELEEAVRHFNNTLKAGIGDEKHIKKALAACDYWQPRIRSLTETHTSAAINLLLEDYAAYPFTVMMNGLKKAILFYIVDLLYHEVEINVHNIETSFDFLLAIKEYERAENLISIQIRQYPDNGLLIYLLAQAQWRNGNKTEALSNYARALLYYPDASSERRIESGPLKNLIRLCGLSMTPAFGWVRNILPLVALPDIVKPRDKQHEHAIKSYQLMQQADQSLKNNDKASSIHFRKQLKEHDHDLYEAYFNLLIKRE